MSNELYKEISRTDTANLIAAVGRRVTVMVEGAIGSGKSALLLDLAEKFKDHKAVYIDMTMLDVGDLQLPAVNHETRTTTFYPNEVLGLHHDGPMIIMFDEFGKASPSVKNAILPALIERRMGNRKFHPDTMVFATTNLGAENVGDMFKAHEKNRMTFVRMAKPTADEWLVWAMNHGQSPEVMAWVRQNPQCFASFDEVDSPNDNHYIYHPQRPATAFVTHRSMAQASLLVAQREVLGEDTLIHALKGTIGKAAAMDLMTFVRMGDTLPNRQDIIDHPDTTPVPTSPAAVIMLCLQSLGWIEENTVDSWMTYMDRFQMAESKAMWASLATKNNTKIQFLAKNKKFTSFAINNSYLFG